MLGKLKHTQKKKRRKKWFSYTKKRVCETALIPRAEALPFVLKRKY